jgi:hypothetical protein
MRDKGKKQAASKQIPSKRSAHHLKALIERGVADEGGLRQGLWFCVERVETAGHPFEKITVWSTLHFTPEGSPYCCGQPMCHLRTDRISDHVRRALGLDQTVVVNIADHIEAKYLPGVEFDSENPARGRSG